MSTIKPCLWFDNQAEEAGNFYANVFPDGEVVSVSRMGEGDPAPVLIMNIRLRGVEYMLLNGGAVHAGFNYAVSFMVDCADQAEVDHFWNALTADGGEPGRCGWLKDRFGLSWQIVPDALGRLASDPDPEKAGRVMAAMMGMDKIVVAELEAAHAGA